MSPQKKVQEYLRLFSMVKVLDAKSIPLLFFVIVALATSVQAAPLPVTVVDTLDFGLLAPGTNGGTVSFPANGSISGTGNVTLLGGEQKGVVTIQATQGQTVRVQVRNGTVNGPQSASMRFTGSCIGPGGVLGIRRCTFIATGGVDVVFIGAVLTVGSNATQDGGHYSGTTRVTARSR